ncbi:sc15 [Pyrrhoderma noxium]|uniref:Sc15 n=1 Tax=Pyrrhoderma noxium TaxID=2282107 RepID=A0A286USR6_9AGAM|nr:sc15 [Pyrrhoderma noxium]
MNIAIVAFSKPIVSTNSLEKRNADATHAHVVLTQLKSTTDSILPEIKNLITNGTVTETSVEPLLKGLIQAFHTAQTSVASLPRNQTDIEKRQDDIGTLIAEIIEEIATVLGDLLDATGEGAILGPLIAALDAAIASLLVSLGGLLTSLVATVASLLATISTLLSTVGLGLIIGVLGLGGLLSL